MTTRTKLVDKILNNLSKDQSGFYLFTLQQTLNIRREVSRILDMDRLPCAAEELLVDVHENLNVMVYADYTKDLENEELQEEFESLLDYLLTKQPRDQGFFSVGISEMVQLLQTYKNL